MAVYYNGNKMGTVHITTNGEPLFASNPTEMENNKTNENTGKIFLYGGQTLDGYVMGTYYILNYEDGAYVYNSLLLKEEEEITVELDMASGNQVILPSTNKVATKVTIIKPENYIPSNIKDGEDLGGVLGTFLGGDLDPENLELLLNTSGFSESITGGIYLFFGAITYDIYDEIGARITSGNVNDGNMTIIDLVNHAFKYYVLNRADNTYVEQTYASHTGVYSFRYYFNNSGYGLRIG